MNELIAGQWGSSSKCAIRSVLASAQVVFDANPSTSTVTPHAVITHQIAWVAVLKSVPRA